MWGWCARVILKLWIYLIVFLEQCWEGQLVLVYRTILLMLSFIWFLILLQSLVLFCLSIDLSDERTALLILLSLSDCYNLWLRKCAIRYTVSVKPVTERCVLLKRLLTRQLHPLTLIAMHNFVSRLMSSPLMLQGTTFPALSTLLAAWAPPLEKSKLSSMCFAGQLSIH